MNSLLLLIPAFPLAGFLILALAGRRLTRPTVALVGAGSVGMAALAALALAIRFLGDPPETGSIAQVIAPWLEFDGYSQPFAFSLDALSLVMVLVVTVVGFLIHLYSTEYMSGDEGYSRFFAVMNLFVASMLVLVLADSLLFLYLGWEGVGLCSYLLIGFWYRDAANGRAARKAFLVTRVGDAAMAVGLFLLFTDLGTLHIGDLAANARDLWPTGSDRATLAAWLLLAGALGKSAQLPLQVWLPDAMAGPTPVSALIHAATMVTAGVYLIARLHALFELAPQVQFAIAVIGCLTLLVAGSSALVQRDIKRVLAYSTISQLGYMFLALGVGAWSAAVFHLVTHAFFKALLFLGAGAVIVSQHHEQDLFRLGGLKDRLPVVFWTFVIGSASLSALPLVTSGFFSKDLILEQAWAFPSAGRLLWAGGIAGALLTSAYTFRMVFLAFFGEPRQELSHRPGFAMTAPLVVLAVFSTVIGFIETPHDLGGLTFFSGLLAPILGGHPSQAEGATAILLQLIATVASLAGVAIAYLRYYPRTGTSEPAAAAGPLERFLLSGWGFDALYDRLIVRPLLGVTDLLRHEPVDGLYRAIAAGSERASALLKRTQTGSLRWYAAAIAAGAVLIAGLALAITR